MGFQVEVSFDDSAIDGMIKRLEENPPHVFSDAELATLARKIGQFAAKSYQEDVMDRRISPLATDVRQSIDGPVQVSSSGDSAAIADFFTRGFATGFLSNAVEGVGGTIGAAGPTIIRRIIQEGSIESGVEFGLNAAAFAPSFYFVGGNEDFNPADFGETSSQPYVLNITGTSFAGTVSDESALDNVFLVRVSEEDAQELFVLMKSMVNKHLEEQGLPLTVE